MNQADDVERVGIVSCREKLASPQIWLCYLYFQWNVIPHRSCFVIALPSNWIKPYRTQSNLINVRLLHFFVRARLNSITEPNHMIEFDWVRLNLINRMFNLVRLVTSGKHKDLKLWNKMCKHDNLKQRKYKLIPVLILKGVGAQKWATINVELTSCTFEVPKKVSSRTLKVRGNSLKRGKYQTRHEYLDIQEP